MDTEQRKKRKKREVKSNYSGREEIFLVGNNCFSKKSTAWSSRLLEVCFTKTRSRSITNCLHAVVERNLISNGFKILSIINTINFYRERSQPTWHRPPCLTLIKPNPDSILSRGIAFRSALQKIIRLPDTLILLHF